MPPSETPPEAEAAPRRRVIKRYSNRKLYDTKDSRYVTLLQIAEMIRADEDIQVFDTATQEDKTDVTLALIISEEMKTRPRGIPLATLKALIRHRGERLFAPLARRPSDPPEEGMVDDQKAKGLRGTFGEWQTAIDARIRDVLPTFSTIRDLQTELRRARDRIEELERRLPPDA